METFQVWHEINNSLTAVNLTLEFLQKSSEEISVNELKNELSFSLQSLAHVRAVIQSANGGEEGRTEPEFFDAVASVEHAVRVLQRKWPKSRLTFTNNVGNLKVKGPKTALTQVFMNLCSNALESYQNEDHRGKLGVKITVKNRKKDLVEITVKDWGAGIAADVHPHIFEQGFSLKKSRGGKGIGLALSKQIIEEQFGGEITFFSLVGKGSVFVVRLPVEPQKVATR